MLGITLGSMPGPLSRTSTMQTKSLVVTSISIFLGGLLRLKAVMLLEIKLMKIVSRWLDSQATVKLKSPVIFKPMFSALNRGLNIWIAWFSGTVKTTAEVGEFGEQNNASSWLIKWALRSLSWCKKSTCSDRFVKSFDCNCSCRFFEASKSVVSGCLNS